MLRSISCTNKHYTSLYCDANTDVSDYNRVFISDVKLSKEVFVHRIRHEPVLLIAEENYSCMIAHQIHKLLQMQGCSFCFHDSILGTHPIEL